MVEEFYNAMPRLSYLFVAAAESLLKINNNFELMEIGGAFVYVKNRG
jgi:chemotaxis methyl-accepting protein methylase